MTAEQIDELKNFISKYPNGISYWDIKTMKGIEFTKSPLDILEDRDEIRGKYELQPDGKFVYIYKLNKK